MNYLQIMSVIFVCSGVLVVVLALFLRAKENRLSNQAKDERLDYLEYDKIRREIDISVSEMDRIMDDFHETVNSAFQEIDEKYRELQFLYTLVDEKKKEVSNFVAKPPEEFSLTVDRQETTQKPIIESAASIHTLLAEISKAARRADAEEPETEPENITPPPKEGRSFDNDSNPQRKEILDLSKQGLSVPEIAEKLNVGKDMVKLVLQLGKGR